MVAIQFDVSAGILAEGRNLHVSFFERSRQPLKHIRNDIFASKAEHTRHLGSRICGCHMVSESDKVRVQSG